MGESHYTVLIIIWASVTFLTPFAVFAVFMVTERIDRNLRQILEIADRAIR